jgi:acetyltransferase-like isoleucine patch superfamily enzyme
MTAIDRERLRILRFTGAAIFSLYRGGLYFLSFLGPFLFIKHFWSLPAPALLVLMILGFGVAGFVFLSLLVLTRKLLIASRPKTGFTTILSNDGRKWFSAALTTTCLVHSPFRSMTSGLSLFACWYYRGMGARMPDSVLLGAGSRITDPWFVEVGENVVIGADAVILGHLGHGDQIVLGRVAIGDGAVVGMRAVIFPDVRIGHNARVGAGAIVVRGTVIPDGETWAGVPARRISAEASQDFDEIGVPLYGLFTRVGPPNHSRRQGPTRSGGQRSFGDKSA